MQATSPKCFMSKVRLLPSQAEVRRAHTVASTVLFDHIKFQSCVTLVFGFV